MSQDQTLVYVAKAPRLPRDLPLLLFYCLTWESGPEPQERIFPYKEYLRILGQRHWSSSWDPAYHPIPLPLLGHRFRRPRVNTLVPARRPSLSAVLTTRVRVRPFPTNNVRPNLAFVLTVLRDTRTAPFSTSPQRGSGAWRSARAAHAFLLARPSLSRLTPDGLSRSHAGRTADLAVPRPHRAAHFDHDILYSFTSFLSRWSPPKSADSRSTPKR